MESTVGSPETRIYSPVTLNQEWPTLGRLLFMILFSCIGTIINGFFVAAFFIEHTLKRLGFVFLACAGFADVIITTVVMPAAAVVLLSGEWDTVPVCRMLQFLTEASAYSYSVFFMFAAIENYFKLCRSTPEYAFFVNLRIGTVSIMVYLASFITAAAGVYMDLDYDYCQRQHHGNTKFRNVTSIIFYSIPCVITVLALVITSIRIRRRSRKHNNYRRSQQYEKDFSLCYLNNTAYLLFVLGWTPYLVVLNEYPKIGDSSFYHCAWIGIFRSVVTSFLYNTMNKSFRSAFARLFYYCCCKSTLTGSFNNRTRRTTGVEYNKHAGDVRVHIMHQAVNSNSPQRAASATRETQEL